MMQKHWPGFSKYNSSNATEEFVMMEEEAVMREPQILAQEDIQEELRRARQDRRAFSNPADRATHLRLFLAWLPKILQDAPGIRWDELPSQAMGHLVRTVADHPDAIPIALAVGCAMHSMKRNTRLARQLDITHAVPPFACPLWDGADFTTARA
jgi:hypothetical protein